MNYDEQIRALSVNVIALQTILAHILDRIAGVDRKLAGAIRHGFDDAASDAENLTIKLGKSALSSHTVEALHIIEELRAATLGNPDKPKHAV